MYIFIIIFSDGVRLDDEAPLGLGDCLSFFSGAERVPPAGFDKLCTLNFNSLNVYPTASTCALVLTLPTMYYNDYVTFRSTRLAICFPQPWWFWIMLVCHLL